MKTRIIPKRSFVNPLDVSKMALLWGLNEAEIEFAHFLLHEIKIAASDTLETELSCGLPTDMHNAVSAVLLWYARKVVKQNKDFGTSAGCILLTLSDKLHIDYQLLTIWFRSIMYWDARFSNPITYCYEDNYLAITDWD